MKSGWLIQVLNRSITKNVAKIESQPFGMHDRIDAFWNVRENRSFAGALNFLQK